MDPTKSSLSVFASIILLIAFVGCSPRSEINTTPSNASATNNNSPPAAPELARLDRFIGTWGGYAGRSSAIAGQIGLDSRFMKVTVKRVEPGEVALEGDIWQAKVTLKYDSGAQKYLLSLTAEDFPEVADLPMTFSETTGFAGEKTFTNNGKEFKARATIKDDDKNQSEWHVTVTKAKDMWNLTIRLGKEQ